MLTNDNDESRDIIEQCFTHHKTVLNPIIDWDDSEVWEFIHEYDVPYCELYDKGAKRLGCIGCPMNGHQRHQFEQYPQIERIYLKAFKDMLDVHKEREIETTWKTPEEVMAWWLNEPILPTNVVGELPQVIERKHK